MEIFFAVMVFIALTILSNISNHLRKCHESLGHIERAVRMLRRHELTQVQLNEIERQWARAGVRS